MPLENLPTWNRHALLMLKAMKVCVCVLVGAQQDLDYRCCLIMKWKQVLAAEIVEAFATAILELVYDQESSSWGVLMIPAAVVK